MGGSEDRLGFYHENWAGGTTSLGLSETDEWEIRHHVNSVDKSDMGCKLEHLKSFG